ncbi:MAG TPA: urate hydroxylase PuuD [Pyrinomonadaceae bacterium]|jgi:uncharacterized membrane protein
MKINPNVSEWLNLLARWFHVFAGILWIGTTYYFTWLDGQLSKEEADAKRGETPQVWMVHSGGFYVVEKQKTPGTRPLHWFRWEAAFTWLSGMFLLVLVYYMGGGMVDADVLDISVGAAVGVGVGALIVGGIVYDLMMRSPLVKSELLFAAVSYALVVGVAYGLTRVMSGRAAYIHVGAMFGTIMAANVWMHILPTQRRMIAAVKEGKSPDAALAARAKLRSKHNTYMVVPLVFTMISNHYPVATYGNEYNWLILALLILLGWGAAHFIRRA